MLTYLRSFLTFPSDTGIFHEATFTKYKVQDPTIPWPCVQAYTQVKLTWTDFEFRHKINRMELWKVPLFEWLPSDFGFLYHAYLVFQTEDQGRTSYWSFEKTSDQKVHIQESADKNDVIEFVAGKRRLQNCFWRPQQMVYVENHCKNMIKIKHMFHETFRKFRCRCLDTKYFAKDAFDLLCTANNSSDEVFTNTSYILDTVKNALIFPFKSYLKTSAFIVFCLYKSLYVAAFWGISYQLSCIRYFSDYMTDEPKKSNESRFIQIYDYE